MTKKLELKKTIYAPQGQILADALTRYIRQSNCQPGGKLPSVRALAEQFHVGRQVILSAIAILSRTGLVYTDSKRGTYVSPTLRKGVSYRIGLFINLENPMIHGYEMDKVYRVARHGGFDAICACNYHEVWTLNDWLEKEREIDGLLITGIVDDALLAPLKRCGLPYFVLGHYAISSYHPQSPRPPVRKTIRKLAEALRRSGGEKVAAITGVEALLSHRNSLETVRSALRQAELPIREELLFYCGDDGYSIIRELLEKHHPDVIVFCLDHWIGYLKYLKQHPETPHPYIIVHGIYDDEAPYPFYDENIPQTRTLQDEAKTATRKLLAMIRHRYEINVPEADEERIFFSRTYEAFSKQHKIKG